LLVDTQGNYSRNGSKETGIHRYYHQCGKVDGGGMTDSVLSKQSNRNKILEKFADHILKESCPYCEHIVRQALTKEDEDYYQHILKNAVKVRRQ
jgi:hypothetical protein